MIFTFATLGLLVGNKNCGHWYVATIFGRRLIFSGVVRCFSLKRQFSAAK
jgi:hypothetical protein